jgi:hypothetical protein
MVCSYTPFEMAMALFENDMAWMDRIQGSSIYQDMIAHLAEIWAQGLAEWADEDLDETQRRQVEAARSKLNELRVGT